MPTDNDHWRIGFAAAATAAALQLLIPAGAPSRSSPSSSVWVLNTCCQPNHGTDRYGYARARAQSPRSSRSRIWVPTQRNKKTCFNPYADWLASLLARARRTHSGGTRFSSRVTAAGGGTRECRGFQTGVRIRRCCLLVC